MNSNQDKSVCSVHHGQGLQRPTALQLVGLWISQAIQQQSLRRFAHGALAPLVVPVHVILGIQFIPMGILGARNSTTLPSMSSQCSDLECFTLPSTMSYKSDDEEVQQRLRRTSAKSMPTHVTAAASMSSSLLSSPTEVMVTVGCKSCLFYVMLSKAHPYCPKCGNTDVLLQQLPTAPLPMKQRLGASASFTWTWCAA